MNRVKPGHWILYGLLIAGLALVVVWLITEESPPAADARHPASKGGWRFSVPGQSSPAPAGGTAVDTRAPVELIRSEIKTLEETFKSSEKARSKVIAKVDNAVISHVKFLIPMPGDGEIVDARQKIGDLCRRLQEAGLSAGESAAEVRRLEDYIDYGSTKMTSKSYRNRILYIDVRHDDGDRMVATVDSSVGDVEYGIQEGTGVPWVRTSGATRMRKLDDATVHSRYGHLFVVKDSP